MGWWMLWLICWSSSGYSQSETTGIEHIQHFPNIQELHQAGDIIVAIVNPCEHTFARMVLGH